MMRRGFTAGIGIACLISALAGHGKRGAAGSAAYEMGERAVLRPFIYNVIETKRESQLGEMPEIRLPENRHLVEDSAGHL
ncbi:MAG: hypothetical protein ABI165_02055 [Bryobacteraceae bacterium]